MDDVHQIPAGDWKYVEIPLHNKPAQISAEYQVLSGSSRVRMALMLHQDLESMNSDPPGAILATPEGPRGLFTDRVRRFGDYVIVLDNRGGRRSSSVRLRVNLDSTGDASDVGRLSPRRQAIVVAVSCVAFLGIVGFSARQLRRAIGAR
jgi:hypothetical protein